MQVPNSRYAYVPIIKIAEYLLSDTHPVGESKRAFFGLLGYDEAEPERLAMDLVRFVQENPVEAMVRTPYGTKWIVSGILRGPAGLGTAIRTVWLVEKDSIAPRFITAYPNRRWNR